MTLKRLIMPVMLMGIILAMAGMASAQDIVQCGLSVPLGATPRATATGHTEPIAAGPSGTAAGAPTNPNPPTAGGGTLRVTCRNNSANPIDTGVVALFVNVGAPITSQAAGMAPGAVNHPAGAPIRLANQTNDFAGAPPAVIAAFDSGGSNANGLIVIRIGAAGGGSTTFTANTTSQFDILGILVSVNGRTAPLITTLTSTGGIAVSAFGTSAPSVQTIDAFLPGLQDPTVPTTIPSAAVSAIFTNTAGGPAVLNSAGGAVKGNFVLRIAENYPDMFREATQVNGPGLTGVSPASPASDTQVQIILNNIPAGLLINNCAVDLTNPAGTLVTGGLPTINFTNLTAAAPILTVNFNAPLDLDNLDVLWLRCDVGAGTATLPLPSTPVTAQVQLAPTGTSTFSASLTAGQIPRYQANPQPATPLTVIVFPPSNTVLLVPFAFVGPGFNTGIAVANTTTDPFGSAGGGAPTSAGTIQFLLVKNDGTTRTYTTAASSPGSGLTGAGVVASGSTYVVNLSELLTAANYGTSFTGYIFITANFTHGHGSATIYTTANGNQALSSPMLVLPGVSTATPRGVPESLGQ